MQLPIPDVGSEAISGPAATVEGGIPADVPAFPLPEGMSLSLWLQGVRANPLLDYRSADAIPSQADVVIIGSGMSGALVAYELLNSANPPCNIVMLEARELCSGATGRNAGHCKPDQYRGFKKYQARFGTEQALKILQNEQETWERLVKYIREENIDCDLWVGKTLDVATTPEVAKEAEETYEAYKAAGGKVDHVEHVKDREEAVRRSRLNSAVSLFSWDASTLYPWKVVAHIIRKSLDKGLHLQTWTPVSEVTASSTKSGQWDVRTIRGTVTAPTVVHATNAYASALLPELKGVVRPTPHMCNKVVPPRSFSGSQALQNSYAVLCPNGALYSVNPRLNGDGIVLFGGSNPNQDALMRFVDADPRRRVDDSLSNFKPVTQAVIDLTQKDFIDWGTQTAPGQGYDYSWSGIIGRSADGVPYIGRVPNKTGQWMICGHNGHGMARIMTAAPGLVKLILGGTWVDTNLPECFEATQERLDRLQGSTFNVPIV